MKSVCLLTCLYIALAIGVVHAASVEVASQGETLVDASAGKSMVRVKLKTHEMQIGKPSDPRPAAIESNCTYSKYPCSIVDQLDITVNGAPLFIPRSAFADLADLNKAKVKAVRKRWVLMLYGGDASESYIVKIDFDSKQVKRRTLSSGMSPDQVLQETIYHQEIVGE
jgi:hypothetical protein